MQTVEAASRARAASVVRSLDYCQVMDPELLAYLAGCVDCDGSINVLRSNRPRADGSMALALVVRMTMTQANPEILHLFRDTFGGRLYHYQREDGTGWWQWYVAGANAISAIEAVRPFLRLKTAQADAATILGRMMVEHRLHRNGQRLTVEQEAERLALADAVRAGNVRRTLASVGPH